MGLNLQFRSLCGLAICCTFAVGSLSELTAQQTNSDSRRGTAPRTLDPSGVSMRFENGRLVSMLQESEQPFATIEQATEVSFTSVGSPFGGFEDLAQLSSEDRVGSAAASVSDVVIGGQQAVVRASRDAGTILLDSPSATNVSLFRRPIISQPYIRGYNNRQIYSQLNGAQWLDTRFDLDTIVSKIDSGIIKDVIVIKGPYSALYGPQLSFIDVVTAPTIRSNGCGVVSEFRTVTNFDENGDVWYARQVAQVGGQNWGARFNFGGRGGVDYESANGILIDANFQQRDIDFAFGYDLANGADLEIQYVRMDLDDVVLSNQLFDIDAMKTDGVSVRYTNQHSAIADQVMVESWYNRNDLAASGIAISERDLSTERLSGHQFSYQASLGYRAALTYGNLDCDCRATTIGTDLRHSKHEIIESDKLETITGPAAPVVNIDADLPDSHALNPGMFFQREVVGDWANYQVGGRLDYVLTEVGSYRTGTVGRDRDMFLYSGFVTGERALNDTWTATFGVGHGQRAPSLIELYADSPFMAITQQALASVQGNNDLQTERSTQVDVGLNADFCRSRMGVRGYYAYVENYITYNFNSLFLPISSSSPPPPAFYPIYDYVNSDSFFTGAEVYGEYDLRDDMSVFANLAYTYGSDVGRFNEPVYGIYPLDSRVGIRYQRGDECRGYGVEVSARMVAKQDRLATSRFERATDGFATGDIRTFLRLRPGMLLTAGVTNFADRLVLEHFDYRLANGGIRTAGKAAASDTFQPGRNYYVGGELTY